MPREKEAELCDGRDDCTPLTVLLWMPERQIPRLHLGQRRLCLPVPPPPLLCCHCGSTWPDQMGLEIAR